MKLLNGILYVSAILLASSCGQNSTKKTETTGDTSTSATGTGNTETTTQVPATGITVPDQIQTTFKTKYPEVKDVSWSRYEPVSSFDWDWSGWPILDTAGYAARFNWEGAEHWAWYDRNNNWVGTVSTVTDFKALPSAVNSAISSQYGGYTITSVDRENDKNRTAYEIDLTKGDDKMTLLMDENGKVLKKKTTTGGTTTKEKNL